MTFHVMSDAFLIIVGSTQVGSLSALVRHQEVEIWAEGEEVEEETRDLDDFWEMAEIAERKAARQAKIVAVPLAKFNTCFGHDFGQQTFFLDIMIVVLDIMFHSHTCCVRLLLSLAYICECLWSTVWMYLHV